MLEGITFQFPKLSFILFFFLACEALCPLRTNAIYFPHNVLFGNEESKPPLWMWVAKWAMISFFIVALMSPVREIKEEAQGYDILLAIDPQSISPQIIKETQSFIEKRQNDRFALYIPAVSPVMIPLSDDHEALIKILSQLTLQNSDEKVTREIERFFSTTSEGRGWAIILSEEPTKLVRSLPVGVEVSVIEPNEHWVEVSNRSHPPFGVIAVEKYFEYYYIYPLFLGFLAMLLYLYGRNQKGLL
jgi:Ca-activated chloride channel family protein